MKRSVLFLSLLLAVAPVVAAPQNYGTISTRNGRVFHDCKVMRIYPDGVSFTHRDGAAKIAFKDLPENLRKEFRYDPQKEKEYQREQAALRKEEQKREKLREAAMQERLMEAQMAEASYLAAARAAAQTAPVVPAMSMALPGETLPTVSYQTPSWVGAPITGSALGGSGYRRSSFAGYFPYTGGYYGYPAYGYGYPSCGYGYPYHGGYGYGYAPGAYVSPTIFRSWNVGNGFRIGVGVTPFGAGIRLFP
jgi:hypothetical protein